MTTYLLILYVYKNGNARQSLLGSYEITIDRSVGSEISNEFEDVKKKAIQKFVGNEHDKEIYFATIHQVVKI